MINIFILIAHLHFDKDIYILPFSFYIQTWEFILVDQVKFGNKRNPVFFF